MQGSEGSGRMRPRPCQPSPTVREQRVIAGITGGWRVLTDNGAAGGFHPVDGRWGDVRAQIPNMCEDGRALDHRPGWDPDEAVAVN
jgi:hypothetical protein